jgi:hypothetical protein
VAYGLALATKLNSLPVLGVPALAVGIRMLWYLGQAIEQPDGRLRETAREWMPGVLKLLGWSFVMLLAAGLVFRVAQPYAFEGPGFFDVIDVNLDLPGDLLSTRVIDPTHYLNLSDKFVQDITNLRNQQSGSDFPPNVQWIGRPFIVFPLSNRAGRRATCDMGARCSSRNVTERRKPRRGTPRCIRMVPRERRRCADRQETLLQRSQLERGRTPQTCSSVRWRSDA